MSKEKQIEEMAEVLRHSCENECFRDKDGFADCDACEACLLYNAGYRKQEWISVGDRLPDAELQKDKAIEPDVLFPCLVVREDNVVSYIDKAWYWGSKFTTQNCTDITDSVTHWMPLPEPPKMRKEDEGENER